MRRFLFGLILCLVPFFAQAQQLRFNASSANIDSFPVVKFNLTVSENGSIPTPAFSTTDLTITEDAVPVAAQLSDCDDSRRTALVICIDQSTSMVGSAGDSWNIYPNFLQSFQYLIENLKPQSKYAILPFTETSNVSYPEPPSPPFFDAQDPADEVTAMSIINGLTFFGGTDVDKALFKAASILEYSGLPTKAIVVVTDEFIRYPDSVQARLQQLGIMLCVFQAGSDFTKYSFDVANATGGLYFQASDSSLYDNIMLEIAEHLSAEHCVLRYVSPNPCPWYKTHQVSLTLQRNALTRNILRAYTLGVNTNDKTPPPFTVLSPTYTTRRVSATGDWPCERGLKEFQDSIRQNIGIFQRTRTYPALASDSLRVQDTLSSARAVYVAVDSGNNRAIVEVLYSPQPDTLAPQIALTSSTGGKYRALITESRPWDRGLVSASLASGALNLVFDSVTFYSRTTGQVWFHQPDPLAVSNGCIEVHDSAGNAATYCIDRSGPAGDTLPPVIVQNPQATPRVQVSADISELRPNDLGIKQVVASGLVNLGNQQATWTNGRQATIRMTLIDSLTPAIAYVSASDSADNVATDTIRYNPLPDVASPMCFVETVDISTRTFRTTDRAAWDRGIQDVTVVGSPVNLNVSPIVFIDRFEAEQTFSLIDKTLPGNIVLRSADSVGHECLTTIDIAPSEVPVQPLKPLQTASMLDFGLVMAPGDVTLLLNVTNPNDRSVVVTKLVLAGDKEFSVTNGTTPLLFAPLETKALDIRYQPKLLNIHTGNLTLANDTMLLAKSDIIGQSIGNVHLYFDGMAVPSPGETGILHLAIEATPVPINLDTIRFALVYNADVAVLAPQMPDCSGNPLCDYAVTYTGDPGTGRIDVEFIREKRNWNQTLTKDIAKIDIPFITFLAKDAQTQVSVENQYASQLSMINSDTGSIEVGNGGCGVELLRGFLRNSTIQITSIKPNPATEETTVSAMVAAGAEATLTIYDATGNCTQTRMVQLGTGENRIPLNTTLLPTGHYTLTLSTPEGFATTTLLVRH